MKRILGSGLLAGAAALVGLLVTGGAAQAHVTVNPDTATGGGYVRVAFRVPTESDTASTTKVQVNLPTDQPITSVSVQPVPGWTATPVKTKLAKPVTTDDGEVTEAVTQITWTADSPDSQIKPGEFQEFPVSLGPLPKSGSVTFKALQTYSDGTIVRWIDLTTPGQPEPDNPAPVLTLTQASAGPGGGVAAATAGAPRASDDDGSSDTAALAVGIAGAVLGLAGLALGAVALSRTRRAA